MTVSQILSYAMAILQQTGLMPFVQAGVVIVLAGVGLGVLIRVLNRQ
jgi:hypothetical protein